MSDSTADQDRTTPGQRYRFYEPSIEKHYLHRDTPGATYLFGHMVSIEHFDGRFHAVWNNHHGGHAQRYYSDQGVPMPFQRLLWQTSQDCRTWSPPIRITEEATETPLDVWDEPHTHWQPNLLNYKDQQLWCIWCIGEGAYFPIEADRQARRRVPTVAGTYLSTLATGAAAKWSHRRIFADVNVSVPGTRAGKEADGDTTGYLFPSQNPTILSSGRVLQPVTCIVGDEYRLGSVNSRAYFSAVIYTDDGGQTWQLSNMVSNPDNALAHWEPHVLEQADGRLRMYIRDSAASRGIHEAPDVAYRMTLSSPLFLTTTGTGIAKGEPVVFEPDAQRVWMEVEGSRMHRLRLPGGRYCMIHHDVWNGSGKGVRSNLALFFSRSDNNDYVAGPGIVGRLRPAHYAQAIAHDGKLYVGYTLWNDSIRTGGDTAACEERGIALSIIDPLPDVEAHYVWPRDKDTFASANPAWRVASTERVYEKPRLVTHEDRTCIDFRECGSAGVEIDPVGLRSGRELAVNFDLKILSLQSVGSLVVCSFGSRIPARIGIPANRPAMLYAYGRDDWQPVGSIDMGGWNTIHLRFGADEFSVQVGDHRVATFVNPIRFPDERLYLGDGYEVDPIESNRGSRFMIDLDSVTTAVVAAPNPNLSREVNT